MSTPSLQENSKQVRFERRQIDAWIRSKPVTVLLKRTTRQRSGAGGYIEVDAGPILPQRFRITSYRRRLSHQAKPDAEGDITVLSYVLTGYHDADVQVNDTFTLDDIDYRVVSIQADRLIRTACEIIFSRDKDIVT